MALVRWQPNRRSQTLSYNPRNDLECFLEELFGPRSWESRPSNAAFSPRVDLRDTPEAFVLKVDLPGVDREGLELTITSELVTLKGERKDSPEGESDCYVCRESFGGTFERVVPLPQSVDADRSEAKLANGVLTVTLPKEKPRKAIKISVS